MSERHIDVMISSTARDLPIHRKEALDACLRMGMFPIMMEHLPANDHEAISASLKMVDEAEIYLGIYAWRYGYIPAGHDISVTEMEYNRAKERGIPRMIFIMHDDHPTTGGSIEKGEGAVKLEKFKERVGKENIVQFFKSPEELRAGIIQSLAQSDLRNERRDLANLHSKSASDIPAAPTPYIAHPYTLLQTSQLAGRQAELNLLTDWVAKPSSPVYQARILNVVAIGGMGKSALAWKWFNDIAPLEMKPLAGRMWWSFYESDARFENFVIRALAYVSGKSREEVEKISPPEREEQLLNILNQRPFLIVLDGLERILIAYARMDAAYMRDDDLDERTANYVAHAYGLPESAAQSYIGQHRLRKTADPRAGNFLRKLANVQASRILVSTRLYPADLHIETGAPRPGSNALFLTGLRDDDALELWRKMDVTGSRDELLRLFHTFDNYPLLIRALAGLVATYRRAPGNFDEWRRNNPDFNPFHLPLVQVQTHVLQFALEGLDQNARKVLHTIAAFRMPASYDTLSAVLVRKSLRLRRSDRAKFSNRDLLAKSINEVRWYRKKYTKRIPTPFKSEPELDATLTDLEDRGLLGWDKIANRYDLHPIVRGVTWEALEEGGKQGVYETLHGHFEAIPDQFSDYTQVNSLEDLAPAIELYNTLIGLGRYDDAFEVFRDRLDKATLWRLSANRQRAELLEMLFPDGLDQPPRLSQESHQAYTLNALALAYDVSGQPGQSLPLFRRDPDIQEKNRSYGEAVSLSNFSNALQQSGNLYEAESSTRRALIIAREQDDHFQEAISLYWLGLVSATRNGDKPLLALHRSLRMFVHQSNAQSAGVTAARLAQALLWQGDFSLASALANRAWELAHHSRYERDFIRAARLQGASALGLGDLSTADERLHHALTRARAVNLVEEELQALVALAELHRRRGEPDKARELLDDVWEGAERGPYPLEHADALNVLAQIERDAGNTDAAIQAAARAYQLAWCDGISADGQSCYAYWWGLKAAREHLDAFGAPWPVLPPFNPADHEPMPEVEINPDDEFHVGDDFDPLAATAGLL